MFLNYIVKRLVMSTGQAVEEGRSYANFVGQNEFMRLMKATSSP